MTAYVYKRTEPQLWTVGFYSPSGEWNTDSDHDSKDQAAQRVAWLNGSVTVPGECPECDLDHPWACVQCGERLG